MSSRPRSLTIADVAAHAGVSQASVSRVLNGNPRVDPGIVKLVTASIAQLGYTPSVSARSLVSGRTHTVAMVVPDLENPLFQGILRGLSRAAAVDGYRVLVADTAEQTVDEVAVALEARQRCDALVLCAPRMTDAQLHEVVARVAPVVVVNRTATDPSVPSVGVDYAHGIRELVDHLTSLGHRHLVYLAGPAASSSNAARLRGIREALAADPGLVIETLEGGSQLDDGYRAGERVAEAVRGGATAALVFNDLAALGLLPRLAELGVSVPGDVSVAGFDDIPLSRFASPRLTTMSVPRAELGAQAWTRLRSLIAGDAVDHEVLFRPRLESRDSTARRLAPSPTTTPSEGAPDPRRDAGGAAS